MSDKSSEDAVIARTRHWIETVAVGMNFCSFAKRELRRNTVRFIISPEPDMKSVLLRLIDQCTLLILPEGFADFTASARRSRPERH